MAIIVDNFSGTPLEGKGETVALDYAGRTDHQPVYVGFAEPSSGKDEPVWKIMKLLYDGNNDLTDRLWALSPVSNKAMFDQVWNDRASLNYG